MGTNKTYFGYLLEEYLDERGLNQLKLEKLLNESGYKITHGLVSKYENGTRKIPAVFIHKVIVCLDLGDEEENALLQAHLADMYFKFIGEYRAISIRYHQKGQTKRGM